MRCKLNKELYGKIYIFLNLLFLIQFSFPSFASSESVLYEGELKKISLDGRIDSVFVSDPSVADYQVINKNNVVVFGRKVGFTAMSIFDKNGGTIFNQKITVKRNYSEVIEVISSHFPDSNVNIYNLGSQVVLSGYVSSEDERDKIYELVGTLLNKPKTVEKYVFGGKDASEEVNYINKKFYEGILNNLEVRMTKQVNVKLSIAEVSKTFLEQFGLEYGTGSNNGVFLNSVVNFTADNILNVITLIGNESVGRILAEPNLSVVSGESASFLVGGELPVVTTNDGGTNVDYKEFGVRLELLAKVQRDNKIVLSLMPEVSSIDTEYSTSDLPALRTRRARTTIELADGQSFVLGGLLNSEDRESLEKIPFIGDVPILGSLFRNSRTERVQSELVIVATVNLVKPVHPSVIQLPTIKKTSTLSRFFHLSQPEELNSSGKFIAESMSRGGFQK